MITIYF